MVVGDAHVFPCFLTPVLTQLLFPKPPTTFLTCFCRGERQKYAWKKVCLNRDQTHNHQVMSLTRSPLSHLGRARNDLHSEMNICTEFEEPMSILCLVIIWTMFGLYIIKLKATVTLTFDRLISKSIEIIYTSRQMCMPNLMNLSQLRLVIMRTRFGLYNNMLIVTVTLTFNRLITKSRGIIYTPKQMSLPFNLMNLGQFCV